ncbi:Uncharacterised protein [Mycobacterium tuberculosis]|jgi:hypothetical protein|nr:Uncharacterised protein [Mycobacterium tuberculosis]
MVAYRFQDSRAGGRVAQHLYGYRASYRSTGMDATLCLFIVQFAATTASAIVKV